RGYMGITVSTTGLSIERVEPGMPAAKAGLRSGDVIARVGTLEPSTFEQVVSHICSFRPGAVVEIEVQRGGERKTVRVKLAARRDLLRVGGSGVLGVSLGQLFALQKASAANTNAAAKGEGGPGFGKAKSVIFVYLQGGPSHLDLWDPKDNVPDKVKSVFKHEQ